MMNKELLLYIKTQLDLGTPVDVIKELLITRGGWRDSDVAEAIRSATTPIPPQPQIQPQPAPAPMTAAAPVSAPVITPTPVSKPAPAPTPVSTPKPVSSLATQPQEISAPAAPVAKPIPTPAPQPVAPVTPPAPVRMPGTTIVQPVTPTATPAPKPIIDIAPTPAAASASMFGSTPTPTPAPAPAPLASSPATQNPVTQQMAPAANPSMTTTMPRPEAVMPGAMSQGITTMPAKKGTKALLWTTILLLVVLLGGAAAYAYMTYFNPKPAVAFAHVSEVLSQSKTGHYKASITTHFDKTELEPVIKQISKSETPTTGIPISENTNATATISLDGSFDVSDAAAPKSAVTVTATTSVLPLSLSFETRSISGTWYVKIPDLSFLNDMLGGNASAFLPGDWVSLAQSEIGEATGGAISVPSATTQVFAKAMPLLLKGNVIVPTVELSKEKYNDVLVHRYQFTLDKTALKQVILQASLAASGTPLSPADAEMTDMFLNNFTVADGEMWVGVWDRKPYKVVFTLKPAGTATDSISAIAFDITFDSFGKPVEITAPTSAKKFISLLTDYQKKAHDSGVKAGLVSVGPIAEVYYASKKSYTGLCTSTNGLKSLLDSYTSDVYCKDSARAYAVALPLMTETGFACIDNNAKIVPLAALPTGAVCK